HYMQDVQELCDRVVVIDKGTLVYEGTLASLSRQFSDTRRLRLVFQDPVDRDDLVRYGQVVHHEESSAVLEIPRAETAAVTSAVLQNFQVQDVSIEEVEIEEVIRQLFSRGK
ncbi:MAG TPA: hypothetical protein VM328_04815, partial [Fimbriimonadaceae bacterium]|nr:hypothetical protein [Fimbriimonadaceae bacterium]